MFNIFIICLQGYFYLNAEIQRSKVYFFLEFFGDLERVKRLRVFEGANG